MIKPTFRTALDIANDRTLLDQRIKYLAQQEAQALARMLVSINSVTDVDLKPCPFCGGKAEFFEVYSKTTGHGESDDCISCGCRACGARMSSWDYARHKHTERRKQIAHAWNRRVADVNGGAA